MAKKFGITFNKFDHESKYIQSSKELIPNFNKTGFLFKDNEGRIVLNEKEDWSEFIDQYLMFPSTQVHDDLIDALSYVGQLAKNVSIEDFEEDDWQPMDALVGY